MTVGRQTAEGLAELGEVHFGVFVALLHAPPDIIVSASSSSSRHVIRQERRHAPIMTPPPPPARSPCSCGCGCETVLRGSGARHCGRRTAGAASH